MMIDPPHNDPYVHSDSYLDRKAMNEWQKLSNYLDFMGFNPFRPWMTFTTEEEYNTPKKNIKIKLKEKEQDMDIERLKTYTAQLKELEAKLADLEPKVEEKKVDIEELLQKVKGGFIHDGVKRSMDYNIKMNQLFYDNDADIPGKKEAIEAMSMSYLLSEKFNEWEKVAIPYSKCKNQLKYLKRKYADIKDTLVQALQCLEENLPEEKN